MKVVHISTSDKGGAGIAAVRLHNALLNAGIESFLLTKLKSVNDIKNHFTLNPKSQLIFKLLDRIGITKKGSAAFARNHLANRPAGFEYFSYPYSVIDIANHPLVISADVIHLHWVSDQFLDFASFFKKINKPVVWTLHDMNPFTGGCHQSDDCMGFTHSCINCVQLKDTIDEAYADVILRYKQNALSKINPEKIIIIAPSQWLLNRSMQSLLFKPIQHKIIRNVIDGEKFILLDRIKSRIEFNLPLDKKIILFVANDIDNPRKGIVYLKQAMEFFPHAIVCGIGKNSSALDFKNFVDMGYITDANKLASLYNAVDVFVLPSLAENFPNTICESLLCGTPVVGFNIGGIPELINNNNGRLAVYKDLTSLVSSIEDIFNNPEKFSRIEIRNAALKMFDTSDVVKNHLEVYNSF